MSETEPPRRPGGTARRSPRRRAGRSRGDPRCRAGAYAEHVGQLAPDVCTHSVRSARPGDTRQRRAPPMAGTSRAPRFRGCRPGRRGAGRPPRPAGPACTARRLPGCGRVRRGRAVPGASSAWPSSRGAGAAIRTVSLMTHAVARDEWLGGPPGPGVRRRHPGQVGRAPALRGPDVHDPGPLRAGRNPGRPGQPGGAALV